MSEIFFNGHDKWQLEFKQKPIVSKDFSHIDDYMKSNQLKHFKDYSQWFTDLHSKYHYYLSTFMKDYIKENNLMPPSTIMWNYIYVDNTWPGFYDIIAFKTLGTNYIHQMVTNHWSESKAEAFLSNKLLFLPISERLSVVISIP